MQLGFTIGPCLFPSIIWQNYGNPLSNAGRLPCSSTMGAFTPLPKGLFTAMQPWVEVSHRKPHRARRAPRSSGLPLRRSDLMKTRKPGRGVRKVLMCKCRPLKCQQRSPSHPRRWKCSWSNTPNALHLKSTPHSHSNQVTDFFFF